MYSNYQVLLGSVMVWDVRQKEIPVAKFLPGEGTTARDCWSVAFGNSYNSEERIVVAGYDNGDIKMYDLKTMSVRWSKCIKNGVSTTSVFPYTLFNKFYILADY